MRRASSGAFLAERTVTEVSSLSFTDGYNVGCLEGVNPFHLEPVPKNDGVNHPADRKL